MSPTLEALGLQLETICLGQGQVEPVGEALLAGVLDHGREAPALVTVLSRGGLAPLPGPAGGLGQMAAAISVAARQCQVIVLTCTPGRFAGVGAASVVRLGSSEAREDPSLTA